MKNFTNEVLRLMIGPEICLNYLSAFALEILAFDSFAEGHFYEGDLLKNHFGTTIKLLGQSRPSNKTLSKGNYGTKI